VVIAITYLSLVFGELVPKRLALAFPERIASLMARPLRLIGVGGAPIVSVLSFSTETVLRILRVRPTSDAAMTEEELRMVLIEGTRSGIIEAAEQEMASAALQLGDRQVSDVMTPRLEVAWLDVTHREEDTWQKVAETNHHWYPVVEEAADTVLGVVAVRDLFAASIRGEARSLRTSLRPVEFVPESLSLLAALERMRQDEVPLAIVVDEYGGTNGIITITDILGAVVGEFASDASEGPDIVERSEGSWLIDGRVSMERLADTLGPFAFQDSGDFQTLAGFVMHALGRIPAVGDTFEAGDFTFEVVDMDLRRVDRVLVTRKD
jgi:putative hemolysin